MSSCAYRRAAAVRQDMKNNVAATMARLLLAHSCKLLSWLSIGLFTTMRNFSSKQHWYEHVAMLLMLLAFERRL
jgi:hypothetical protein